MQVVCAPFGRRLRDRPPPPPPPPPLPNESDAPHYATVIMVDSKDESIVSPINLISLDTNSETMSTPNIATSPKPINNIDGQQHPPRPFPSTNRFAPPPPPPANKPQLPHRYRMSQVPASATIGYGNRHIGRQERSQKFDGCLLEENGDHPSIGDVEQQWFSTLPTMRHYRQAPSIPEWMMMHHQAGQLAPPSTMASEPPPQFAYTLHHQQSYNHHQPPTTATIAQPIFLLSNSDILRWQQQQQPVIMQPPQLPQAPLPSTESSNKPLTSKQCMLTWMLTITAITILALAVVLFLQVSKDAEEMSRLRATVSRQQQQHHQHKLQLQSSNNAGVSDERQLQQPTPRLFRRRR